MSLKLSPPERAADHARQIKDWAVRRFGEGEESWLVTETACALRGPAMRQTTLILFHPAASIAFRIAKPLVEVTEPDVDALGEAAANLAESCC